MSEFSSELMHFLLPKFDDPLQVGFLVIICVMMAYTIGGVHWVARPASWEKKWNRGVPGRSDDGLDIEHGSVTDLWHAVATSSEKLAEIMPGMLLVVGLLGTFLGLGMALDHASSILGQSNAVADSMGDLLGLLKGLGTKFKTSTWGIMGFVLLKIWSEATRFEEKRLIWVIEKVKSELDRRARERRSANAAAQHELFQQIALVSGQIVEGVSAAIGQASRNQQQTLNEVNETLKRSHGEIREGLAKANERVLKGLHRVHEALNEIHISQQSSSEALTSFTKGIQRIVGQMASAANGMVEGAEKVSTGAQGLQHVVEDFGSQFRLVLDNVRHDLGRAIDTMSQRSSETMKEGSEKLECATREISIALGALSESVNGTMGKVEYSINEALEIQKKSSYEFTASAETLNRQIEETTLSTKQLGESIKSGLASVADAGRHMRSIGKSLGDQVPILDRIANQEQPIELSAILEELQAIGALHRTLTPLVQDGLLRKLPFSGGAVP